MSNERLRAAFDRAIDTIAGNPEEQEWMRSVQHFCCDCGEQPAEYTKHMLDRLVELFPPKHQTALDAHLEAVYEERTEE